MGSILTAQFSYSQLAPPAAKVVNLALPWADPDLSVVIPVYNIEPYVGAAILSALNQTHRNIEVIVVDDGSTDGSTEVIARIVAERNDPRLRVIRQPNRGLSAARNTGVDHARAPLVGFLDGDDIWRPEKAAAHIAALRADAELGISFSLSEYMTEDGRATGRYISTSRPHPSLHDMIRRNHVGNGSAPVVRRELLLASGPFRQDLRSCEDYEMWCRMMWMTGCEVRLIDEPLTLYRLRSTSLSFSTGPFIQNSRRAMEHLESLFLEVPRRVISAGQAEHYRIAASRAARAGHRRECIRLIGRSVLIRPAILVREWRTLATLAVLAVPRRILRRYWV